MVALAATYRVEAEPTMLDGYWLGLADLDYPAFEHAAKRAMAECDRMPNVRQLLQLAGCAPIPLDQRATVAWTRVYDAIGSHGAYATVSFDDPATTATVRAIGGWTALCSRSDDELRRFVQHEFRRVYQVLASRPIDADRAEPMLGLHDQRNAADGRALTQPATVATGLPPATVRTPMLSDGKDERHG